MRTVCLIHGCQGQSCCEQVKRELRQVDGVRAVDVNLYKATATVDHDEDCDVQQFVGAIERAGCVGVIVRATKSVDGPECFYG